MKSFIENNLRWLFPLPAVLFILAMIVFPLFYTLWVSLTDWSLTSGGQAHFIGLRNYAALLHDGRFFNALKLTLYFTALAVSGETLLGVAVALLLNRSFAGKILVKTVLLLPMVATPVAVGLAWMLFYEPTVGLANYTLGLFGLPGARWLADPATVIPSLALVDVWEWTPMIALIVMAGLASLPGEPLEAARIDGANAWQAFRHVTLPLLTPTILVAVALRSIDALKTFDIIYAMTEGGPGFASETVNIYAYTLSFQYFRFGAASSVLVALLALVLGCSGGVLYFRGRQSG